MRNCLSFSSVMLAWVLSLQHLDQSQMKTRSLNPQSHLSTQRTKLDHLQYCQQQIWRWFEHELLHNIKSFCFYLISRIKLVFIHKYHCEILVVELSTKHLVHCKLLFEYVNKVSCKQSRRNLLNVKIRAGTITITDCFHVRADTNFQVLLNANLYLNVTSDF
jgi:hypothetical protein